MSDGPKLLARLLRDGSLVVATPPRSPAIATELFLDGGLATRVTRQALADPALLRRHQAAVDELVGAIGRVQPPAWVEALRQLSGALAGCAAAEVELGLLLDGVVAPDARVIALVAVPVLTHLVWPRVRAPLARLWFRLALGRAARWSR